MFNNVDIRGFFINKIHNVMQQQGNKDRKKKRIEKRNNENEYGKLYYMKYEQRTSKMRDSTRAIFVAVDYIEIPFFNNVQNVMVQIN